MAHRGLLFLDEFPEFPRGVLESLRQPLEDGTITVIRSRQMVTYPARFMLSAAMNPCPCGNDGSDVPCTCTPIQARTYRQRVSGPLLDRIDLHVRVSRVETEKLLSDDASEPSDVVRKRVTEARSIASDRGRRHVRPYNCNAEIPPGDLLKVCGMDDVAAAVLTRLANRKRLSARAVHRILRVVRTIADLSETDTVVSDHIYEAVEYRVPADREVAL